MTLRLFIEGDLQAGSTLALPADAARHVQVLRLQPGDAVWLFNGADFEWPARILQMGRREVSVDVGPPLPVQRELACHVTLALGMPANERMDALVEKAVELGAARIQPLHCERSVLRLTGERAERRRAHWQGVAVAASEQSGRTRVPEVAPILGLAAWLAALPGERRGPGQAATSGPLAPDRWLLSLDARALPLARLFAGPIGSAAHTASAAAAPAAVWVLSGPEGGLTAEEQAAAQACGFAPVSLGPRTLRADTAPLAALAWIAANP
jgi:16S rRNA (uracil1498-N3)-methyltransferase